MKMKIHSVIAGVLSAVMLLSVFTVYGAGNSKVAYAEGDETVGKYESMFLDSLGIVNFPEDKLGETVTNMDFAGAAALIRGLTTDYYRDGMLEILTETGYMPDVCKYPDRPINYMQALKTLVSVLGYDNDAEMSGGYPMGYLLRAGSLGLTDGININADSEEITFGILAKLIYNALDCTSRFVQNKKVIEDVFGIYKSSGRVTGNSITDFEGKNQLNTDTIKIDNQLYLSSSDKFDDFFGYNVKFWYKEDTSSSGAEVMYMETDDSKSKIVEVSGDDIGTYDKAGNIYTYYNNRGRQSIRLSAGYCLVYNGRVLNMGLEEVVSEGGLLYKDRIKGNIIFSDNDSDGKYDLIKVNSYESIYVKKISSYDNTVTAYFDADRFFSFDTDNPDSRYRICDEEGETLLWSNIIKGSVITVLMAYDESMKHESGGKKYLSYDGPIADIIISAASVTGIVEKIEESGAEAYIYADGVKYRVSDNAVGNLNSIILGNSYKLMFDMFGEVAGFEREDEIFDAGLVIRCGIDDCEETVLLKIFDENGNIKNLECAEKVKIDGKNYKTVQTICEALKSSSGKSEFIRYRLNEEGLIICVDTPYYNKGVESEKSLQKISNSLPKSFDKYIRAFNGVSGDKSGFPVDSASTVMFSYRKDIPYDEEEYIIEDFNTLFNRTYSDVTAYTIDAKSPSTDYVVIALSEDEGTLLTGGYTVFALDEIIECYSDDEIKYTLKGINLPRKASTEIVIKDISKLNDAGIKRGDIFTMRTKNSGEPGQIAVAYRSGDGVAFEDDTVSIVSPDKATTLSAASNKWVQGKAFFADKGYIYVLPKSKLDTADSATISDCIVVPMLRYTPGLYLINEENRSSRGSVVEEISIDDIRTYLDNGGYADDVLICARPNDYSAVIVMRNE